MFGRAAFPNPNEPGGADLDKINSAWKSILVQQDPSLKQVFEQHPAWQPIKATLFQPPQLNEDGGLPNTWQLVGDLSFSTPPECRRMTAPVSLEESSGW